MGKRNRNTSESSYNSSEDDFETSSHTGLFTTTQNSNNGVNKFQNQTRRRGRGPSKNPCLNKNALMARQNRQRKKEYMENIENQLNHLRRENKNQSTIIRQQTINLRQLTAENSYLRSVLKNKTTITTLLSSMNAVLDKKNANKIDCNDKMAANDVEKISSSTRQREKIQETPKTVDNDFEIKNHIKTFNNPKTHNSLPIFKELNRSYTPKPFTDDLYDFNDVKCDLFMNGMDIDSHSSNTESVDTNGMKSFSSDIDLAISDVDNDQFHSLDQDLFGNIQNITGDKNLDLYKEDSSTGNLFEDLDNVGVCFHVNSGKVSMEFCTICHLNSINSDDPV